MRIAVGDWVRVGSFAHGQVSVAGVGKIIDGDHDPEYGALGLAQVELPRGRVWFHAGDLARIAPDEEARLAESALATGLLQGVSGERLRAAVGAFRRGVPFVRSPLILDALWACLPETVDDARARLVRIFEEESLRVLAPPAVEPVTPTPHAPHEPVLTKLLDALDRTTLGEVATKVGLPVGPSEPTSVRRKILGTKAELATILAALTPPQIVRACRAIGFDDDRDPDVLRSQVLEAARAASPSNANRRRAAQPKPSREPLLVRILGALNHTALREVAAKAELPIEQRSSARELRGTLVRGGVDIATILAALTPGQLALACRMIGIPGEGEREALEARILEAARAASP